MNQDSLPWMCAADFNELLYDPRRRGVPYKAQDLLNFHEVLTKYGFQDVGLIGYKFT